MIRTSLLKLEENIVPSVSAPADTASLICSILTRQFSGYVLRPSRPRGAMDVFCLVFALSSENVNEK